MNDRSIGSFVRGFGAEISVSNVHVTSDLDAFVDTHSPFGKLSSNPVLRNVKIEGVTVDGTIGNLVHVPSPLISVAGGKDEVHFTKLVDVAVENLKFSKSLKGGVFDPNGMTLNSAERSSPNFRYNP